MNRKIFALLCVLLLSVPVLCASEMTEYPFDCDSCGYHGPGVVAVTGTETRDNTPGELYTVSCYQCGACLLSTSWRATGHAEVQDTGYSEPETSDPDPDPEPEQPASPPAENSSGGGDSQPAVQQPAAQQPAPPVVTVTQPPVPESQPAPAEEAPAAQPAADPAPQPAVEEQPQSYTPQAQSRAGRRNLQKYPCFSAAYPSRRLNLPGDPDAWAPIPGPKIYPLDPADGSSILQRMLNGAGGGT